jgi:hypothetical protein
MDHDRLAIVCVFGAATASIMLLIFKSISGYGNAWGKGRNEFSFIIQYYPLVNRCVTVKVWLPYGRK